MSKHIELEILLENTKQIYSGGEKVKGQVKAIVDQELQCDALEIILGALGFADSKDGVSKFTLTVADDRIKHTLYQGRWSAGTYAFPFEVEVPSGPPTYKGEIIDVSWYLRAEARPSKGEITQCEVILCVVPGKEPPEEDAENEAAEVVYKESPKGSMGCLMFSLLLCAAGVAGAVKLFQSGKDDYAGFGVFVALLALALIFMNLYQMLISKRIAMAEARLGSAVASPGDHVPCSLTFQVKSPVEIDGASVTLTGREEAGNVGVRASKRSFQKVIYEKRRELELPVKEISANVPIQTRGQIAIPPDAASSFRLVGALGEGIRVRWNVEFRIKMGRWPDWFHRQDISIRPRPV
jgi:hypothetical protein